MKNGNIKKLFAVILSCILLASVMMPLTTLAAQAEPFTFTAAELYRMTDTVDEPLRTFEATIKIDSANQYRGGVIFSSYRGALEHYIGFEIYTNGNPALSWRNGDGSLVEAIFTDIDVRAKGYQHVAVVRDQEKLEARCYINGELVQTVSYASHASASFDTCTCHYHCIGGDARSGNILNFKGQIKDIAVWSDVRTADEIAADMTNPTAVSGDNLVANYDITAYDSTIKGFHDLGSKGIDAVLYEPWYDKTAEEEITDYAYSMAVIGDTQNVAWYAPEEYEKIFDWIVDNKETKNIQFALHMGDITEKSYASEWEIASRAIRRMDGVLPYSIVRGNHDKADGYTKTFTYEDYRNVVGGTFDGTMLNYWTEFTVGSIKYLNICLDFGPTDAVLEWANKVVEDHPYHNVIVTTHAYMDATGEPIASPDENGLYPGASPLSQQVSGGNNGDDMWNEFISKHKNIVLVISGHVSSDDIIVNQSKGVHGNTVTQMLIDQQAVDFNLGASGLVVMFYFSEDGSHITVENYSPIRNKYFQKNNNSIELDINVVRAPDYYLDDYTSPNGEKTPVNTPSKSPDITEPVTPAPDVVEDGVLGGSGTLGGKELYWDGSTVTSLSDTTSLGTKDDPIIIYTPAEMVYLNNMGVTSAGDTSGATYGKYYKIADGISAFYFDAGVKNLTTAEQVKTYFESKTASQLHNYTTLSGERTFQGHFDGNGVTFYGVYNKIGYAGGVFNRVADGASVENVNVAKSYIYGKGASGNAAGGIVGSSRSQSTTININKCSVTDCYIYDAARVAGIFAYSYNDKANITSCFVADNILEGGSSGIGGFMAAGWTGAKVISDSVSLGASAYTNLSGLSYSNVYTDTGASATGIELLAAEAVVTGNASKTTMPQLSWGINWLVGAEGKYPTLNPLKVLVWDGTAASGLADTTSLGTEEDPILIFTPAEMVYLNNAGVTSAGDTSGATYGKYYKIADGIGAFYFDEGVKNLTTAAEVKDYFEAKVAAGTAKNYTTLSGERTFQGHFDGNGVTFYGIYNKIGYAGGVFNRVADGASVKNVNVSKSYINGKGNAAGGIIGSTRSQAKTFNIQKCSVTNCYIADTAKTAGILANAYSDKINVNSCLVADNLYGTTDNLAGFTPYGWAKKTVADSICIGVAADSNSYAQAQSGNSNMVFTNTYSDTAAYGTGAGIALVAEDAVLTGAAAQSSMPGLAWGINWKAGAEGEYPQNMTADYVIWDGTSDTSWAGSGTQADPYIISTPSELYGMVSSNGKGANGAAAYFKVADGVKSFYMNAVKGMTAAEAKAYLASDAGKVSWNPTFDASNGFVGNFDGNGVTVYGLYNEVASGTAAFIPFAGKNATVKNITFASCHFVSGGNTADTGNAAVVIGRMKSNSSLTLTVTNCIVKNSYVKSGYAAALITADIGYGARPIFDNIITYGNEINCDAGSANSGALIGAGWNLYTARFTDIVIADESIAVTGNNIHFAYADWSDVYTAAEIPSTFADPDTAEYYFGNGITKIDAQAIKGDGAKALLTGLDFNTEWITTSIYPTLRALHTLSIAPAGDGGHTEICADADCATSFGEISAHNYNASYKCTDCAYQHTHKYVNDETVTPASCTAPAQLIGRCACGATTVVETSGAALGHTFGETVEAVAATCTSKGNVAYKHCSVCDKNFAADASVTETQALETIQNAAFAEHVSSNNYAYNENSHCLVCDTCGKAVTGNFEHTFGDWYDVEGGKQRDCECGYSEFEKAQEPEVIIPDGWKIENGKWYYYKNNVKLTSTFIETNGYTYYVDETGLRVSNDWIVIDGAKYFAQASGILLQNRWFTIEGTVYYFGDDGKMATGLRTIDGNTYFFNEDGIAQKDVTLEIEGETYYFNVNGIAKNGWQTINGERYYVKDNGTLAANGILEIGGYSYYFDVNGVRVSGAWVEIDGDKYYAQASGILLQNRWFTIEGTVYYFGDDCKMATGLTTISGNTYYFDENGVALKNTTVVVDGQGYYLNANGIAKFGWQTINGERYYVKDNGTLAANGILEIGGYSYYFDANGVRVSGAWVEIDGAKYYAQASGILLQNRWYTIEGTVYYFGADCKLVTGN